MENYIAKAKSNHTLNRTPLEEDTIAIVQGNSVLHQVSDKVFLADWEELYKECKWATIFQSPVFVVTWYMHYHKVYQPILIKATHEGKLTGLLTLAMNEKGKIVGAGDNQAEYQVWLSQKSNSESFIVTALLALRKQFPSHEINLKFIPSQANLNWAGQHVYFKKFCLKRTVKQPLMKIDETRITQELRKKNRREKLNRLRRQGELKFEKIIDAQSFSEIMEELTVQSDFRKGAMYNKRIFQQDQNRKAFLLELFRKGILHTTVLKVDENIIASNASAGDKGWLHLQGINTHSPFYAKHSPGILHFLMLGNLMAEEGKKVFDLTPGSDPYKDTLATHYEEATELKVYGEKDRLRKQIAHTTSRLLKKGIASAGVSKANLHQYKFRAELIKEKTKLVNFKSIKFLLSSLGSGGKINIYKLGQAVTEDKMGDLKIEVRKNDLQDILLYKPGNTLITKWEVLIDAMKRFEQGQHCYTWSENKSLLGIAWMATSKTIDAKQLKASELPNNNFILYDFKTYSKSQGKMACFIEAVNTKVIEEINDPPLILSQSKMLNAALKSLRASPLANENLSKK